MYIYIYLSILKEAFTIWGVVFGIMYRYPNCANYRDAFFSTPPLAKRKMYEIVTIIRFLKIKRNPKKP